MRALLVVVALIGCKDKKKQPEPAKVHAPPASLKVAKIGAGDGAACAVMDNGTVRCWGRNDYGERGTAPSHDDAATPVAVAGITDAVDIVMGGDSGSSGDIACAIKKDKTATCWGGAQMIPKEPLTDIASLALGGGTGYIVKSDGTVWGWGSTAFNALSDGTESAGPDKPLTQIPNVAGAKQLAAGQNHACALLGDGSVTCWGYPSKHLLATPVPGLAGVTAVFAMSQRDTTCAIVADAAHCWNDDLVAKPVASLTSITKIAGRNHSCALTAAGEVLCWGDSNDVGQLGTNAPATTPSKVGGLASKVVDIAVGHAFSCAAYDTGEAACWGYNQRGQIGDGTLANAWAPSTVEGITAVTLAPAKDGLAKVEEGEDATRWDGLPATCKRGPLEIRSKGWTGPFTIKAAKAGVQMNGKTITVELADHNFHKSWGRPRGTQARLGLRFAKVLIHGDKREPVAIDAGAYTLGIKEERLVYPSFETKTGSTNLISVGLAGVDTGTVTITHLDDTWVCGELALAAEGSSVKGPFAAPITK